MRVCLQRRTHRVSRSSSLGEIGHFFRPLRYDRLMEYIAASKFKEKCLDILDHLAPGGLVVTKHGKPVARVIPAGTDCAELIGSMKGKIGIRGDILSTGVKWNAES